MQTDQPLTDEAVLQFVRETHRDHQRVPPIREVAKRFGHNSTTSVQRSFARLVEGGQLARDGHRYRLPKSQVLKRGLPLLGWIAAGPLSEAIENVEHIDLGDLYDPATHWGLEVRGDSMIEAHILDGDIAVIRTQATCNNGDIVVAMVDGDATLKRFFKRKDHIVLQPENKRLKPIMVKDVEIRGVLVGLVRKKF